MSLNGIGRLQRMSTARRGFGITMNFGAGCFGFALLLFVAAPDPATAQTPAAPRDLSQTSLEDLMNVDVTSVSRKEQKLSKVGASVFVITQDDILRSGAANIPDVLRMAPGVDVAQVDVNAWAISIRGFNSRYTNSILVLIDGRSLASPAFTGVNWDQINVPLEDIERIEVIRGPGGTAWGANAVGGVINIITKTSKATQGGLLVAEAGNLGIGTLAQYGGKVGADGTYRAFGKYFNTDSSVNTAGGAAADGWHGFQGGLRMDFEPSSRDKIIVQGDLYQFAGGQTLTTVLSNALPTVATFNDPVTLGSGDLQGQWSHTLLNGSDMSLNVYFNHANRYEQPLIEDMNSVNIDFQHHIAINSRNDVVWGLAYRVTDDKLSAGYAVQWSPGQRTDNLFSGFVQDEIKLAKSAWFTIGSKLEHNAYTGLEYEPSAQFVWTPTDRQTIWASASRAIRQPSREDTDVQFDVSVVQLGGGNFGVVKYIGDNGILAQQVLDFETGYRAQVTKRLSFDVAAFRSYYSNLEGTNPGTPYFTETPAPPHLVIPLDLSAGGLARTYGGELSATWNVTSRWRLSPGYTIMHTRVITDPANPTSTNETIPGTTPKHQIPFRSTYSLRSNLNWDAAVYFVGQLSGSQIPAYTRVDTQLRWRVMESVELSITGQNLLTAQHIEFVDVNGTGTTEIKRSVIGKITWRF